MEGLDLHHVSEIHEIGVIITILLSRKPRLREAERLGSEVMPCLLGGDGEGLCLSELCFHCPLLDGMTGDGASPGHSLLPAHPA